MKLPLVALCGRPNVGKSTLFNRLTRTRAALVHDLPGMTRDRSYGRVTCLDEEGTPEEVFELVDTGGLDYEGEDVITSGITRMAEQALKDAHVVVLMVDGHSGVTTGDEEIASRIIRMGKPCLLAVNKLDGMKGGAPDGAFYGLGIEEVRAVSAAHGSGVPELLDRIRELLPFHRHPDDAEHHELQDELRLAMIGRPNVGKSSLTNKLLGYERSLVSEVAGTTRDAVDTVFTAEEQVWRLIDTAGIRRKGKTSEGAEILSILKAKQAMARADVSLLLIDAVEGVTHQDAVVAGYAQDAGAAVILVVNKWDLVPKDTYTVLAFEEKIRHDLGFLNHAPMTFVSALTGQRVQKLFGLIKEVAAAHSRRVPTGKLNGFLREAVAGMSPHYLEGKRPKLYFMTQVGTRPPSFVIKANTDRGLHFSYMRYLENRLREAFGFIGTPIRLSVQKKQTGDEAPADAAKVRQVIDPGMGLKPGRKKEHAEGDAHRRRFKGSESKPGAEPSQAGAENLPKAAPAAAPKPKAKARPKARPAKAEGKPRRKPEKPGKESRPRKPRQKSLKRS
ncbi:MAG: ribosome biogenesis GTPase Der [Holophagaceae bacterium]|nr:ribosome biogenesis GTPase Der [Holophagaceae bacterium]